jgi:hypothetical protein
LIISCNTETQTDPWQLVRVYDSFGDSIPGKFGVTGKFYGKKFDNNSDTKGTQVVILIEIHDSAFLALKVYDMAGGAIYFGDGQSPVRIKINGESTDFMLLTAQDFAIQYKDDLLGFITTHNEPLECAFVRDGTYRFTLNPEGLRDRIAEMKAKSF